MATTPQQTSTEWQQVALDKTAQLTSLSSTKGQISSQLNSLAVEIAEQKKLLGDQYFTLGLDATYEAQKSSLIGRLNQTENLIQQTNSEIQFAQNQAAAASSNLDASVTTPPVSSTNSNTASTTDTTLSTVNASSPPTGVAAPSTPTTNPVAQTFPVADRPVVTTTTNAQQQPSTGIQPATTQQPTTSSSPQTVSSSEAPPTQQIPTTVVSTPEPDPTTGITSPTGGTSFPVSSSPVSAGVDLPPQNTPPVQQQPSTGVIDPTTTPVNAQPQPDSGITSPDSAPPPVSTTPETVATDEPSAPAELAKDQPGVEGTEEAQYFPVTGSPATPKDQVFAGEEPPQAQPVEVTATPAIDPNVLTDDPYHSGVMIDDRVKQQQATDDSEAPPPGETPSATDQQQPNPSEYQYAAGEEPVAKEQQAVDEFGDLEGAIRQQQNTQGQPILNEDGNVVEGIARNPETGETYYTEPPPKQNPSAETTKARNSNAPAESVMKRTTDWRFRISLAKGAKYFYAGNDPGILLPLKATQGVLFPYTPTISLSYAATYEATDIPYTNYKMYNYRNSAVEQIQITGEFTAQDYKDATYVLAVMHFFKSVTKMFYGGNEVGAPRGTPPPLCYLNGHGDYGFNEHPVVITNFSMTYKDDVDYIDTFSPPNLPGRQDRLTASGLAKGGNAKPPAKSSNSNTTQMIPTKIPTRLQIQLTCLPIVARQNVSNNFSLTEYASGKLLLGRNNPKGGGFW